MTEEQKLRRKEKQAIYHRQWQIKNADKLNKYQRDRRKNILSAAGAAESAARSAAARAENSRSI